MNWKKFLLIALTVGAFAFAAAPKTEARISVGIGLGFPIGIGYNGYGNGYYNYGNQGCYPYSSYDYYGYRPRYYSRPVVYVGQDYYWYHGRRVYRHRHHYRHWR